jgi:uncharacterized protein YeaC (DUF1315 family)
MKCFKKSEKSYTNLWENGKHLCLQYLILWKFQENLLKVNSLKIYINKMVHWYISNFFENWGYIEPCDFT